MMALMSPPMKPTNAHFSVKNDAWAIARGQSVIENEIKALHDLCERLDDTFVRAIELLENCRGRVIITGMGKSGHIGKKMAATFSSVGTPAVFMHPAEGSHGDLGVITRDDVVIAISNSGETQELIGVLPTIKRFGLPLIAMTGRSNSSLGRRADVVLDISVEQEACPLNLAPTSSTTVTLALGDALALVLLERKGFTSEDFAMFHPAGTLGKQLLMQVEDIMTPLTDLPVHQATETLLDTVLDMTSKQSGIALVVSDTGNLKGIVTDGDVRRSLKTFDNVKDTRLNQIMTPNPLTIDPKQLAAKAVKVMEDNTIHALVVVEAGGQVPLGIVTLQALIKAGLR